MNKEYFHAIELITKNCTGCTQCVAVCPTEALRVRDGKVRLDAKRCVDCGNCIKACHFNAILPLSDKLEYIKKYKYKIAILSVSYPVQFTEEVGYANAKKAILDVGFDAVVEEAMVTQVMGQIIREYVQKSTFRPVLACSCPAVSRLIQLHFTSLLPSLIRTEYAMNCLALYMREKIAKQKKIDAGDIGIFQIVPCPAQVAAAHQPEGNEAPAVDGAISISDVYNRIMTNLHDKIPVNPQDVVTYDKGLTWAIAGREGEDIAGGKIRVLSVDGIENIIEILSKIENQHFHEPYDFVVLRSCSVGCVGGVLNVENPFIAASRVRRLINYADEKVIFDSSEFYEKYLKGDFNIPQLEPRSIMKLDDDIRSALSKMKRINEILELLPKINCRACGSPTCRSLAEDIVGGKAHIEDCVVLSRKNHQS